jgi:uncharacterized damage-inducible protein DinB
MDATEFATDGFGRIAGKLHRTLQGLGERELSFRPHEDANSIAWLAWHLTRVQDDHMSEIAGREQAWVADGWAQKFGREPDPHDQGTGDMAEQVASIKPDGQLLLEYHDAVNSRTLEYLTSASGDDFDRIIDRNYTPAVTVGVRTVSVINDNTEHVGQAAYVRGLIEQRRWLGV